jgi:hypothetical protein
MTVSKPGFWEEQTHVLVTWQGGREQLMTVDEYLYADLAELAGTRVCFMGETDAEVWRQRLAQRAS